MSRFLNSAFSLAICLTAPAWSATQCPQHFPVGQTPVTINPKLKPRTQELCFRGYAVLHSGLTRTPLYAAEHLTRNNVRNAAKLLRLDSFHAEDALPEGDRAELEDYRRSGYDRGHMAPYPDFATRMAQAESFSLANTVPQVHENNVRVWAGIECAARQLATDEGEVYVISGPAFIGGTLKKIGNVLVPTHLWKVLYSPAQQRAGAYFVTNDETRDYSVVTVSKLEKMVGLSLLPGLPQQVRDAGMTLPKPIARQQGCNSARQSMEEFTLRDFSSLLSDALPRAAKP